MSTTTRRAPARAEHVWVEPAAEGRLAAPERFALWKSLLDAGHAVSRAATPDAALGAVSVTLGGEAADAPSTGTRARIALEERGAEAGGAAELVLARVNALATGEGAAPAPGWAPWFPVIDYQRCTNCMQCLSFCLFDVYGVDEQGKIEVRNEEKCKTNCPACSRVCPEVAILFPKYAKGPINGDQVRAEDVTKESMKVDISALLGGDIYSALKERAVTARQRFSTERDESKALLERKRCLKELQGQLDIPDEVLMSLPSAGEIEERARRAREKMEARRARSQSVKDESVRRPATTEEWGI